MGEESGALTVVHAANLAPDFGCHLRQHQKPLRPSSCPSFLVVRPTACGLPPAASPTMSITVRLMKESDFDDADRVAQAAFERPVSFRPTLRLHHAIEPDGLWVATVDRQVVGTVSCVDYDGVAYVGLMTVDPRFQRRGIARRLMSEVLAWLDRRRSGVALLDATDFGAPLYEQLGFQDDAHAYAYERVEIRSGSMVTSGLVHAAVDGDLADIVALDALAFGANRGKLLRALWGDFCSRCLVARNASGILTGYLFARDPILGPWGPASPRPPKSYLPQPSSCRFRNSRPSLCRGRIPARAPCWGSGAFASSAGFVTCGGAETVRPVVQPGSSDNRALATAEPEPLSRLKSLRRPGGAPISGNLPVDGKQNRPGQRISWRLSAFASRCRPVNLGRLRALLSTSLTMVLAVHAKIPHSMGLPLVAPRPLAVQESIRL